MHVLRRGYRRLKAWLQRVYKALEAWEQASYTEEELKKGLVVKIEGHIYRRQELLPTQGSRGAVYKATRDGSWDYYVLKFIHPSNFEDCIYERIRKAGGHKNIVAYYGATSIASLNRKCIALEYVTNATTQRSMQTFGTWTSAMSKQYEDVWEFLQANQIRRLCENEGGNVLVRKDGVVKLVDFDTLGTYEFEMFAARYHSVYGPTM